MENPMMSDDVIIGHKGEKAYDIEGAPDNEQETGGKGTQAYDVEAQRDDTGGKGTQAYDVEGK